MKLEKNFVEEIAALKKQFDGIKSETEDFIQRAKGLSERGAHEAKEVLDSAKDNWHSIVSAFESSSIAKFFSKSKKKPTKKKVITKAKKVVKKAKKKIKK